ncbi:MAG: Asp-tRNA(Asn)/Glu-tRNA(Gln) amidotransferase subunit GatC [Candidatus Omnitrophota bacterium]|nr:Asp-tRNA(Asn)/Glu-tRNA(Gln) amidotransferase subunit GatC [Candidatus Omnitrophota bacterium]
MKKASGKRVITEDVVKYVAGLSRLSLGEKETVKFCGQLSDILGYIDQLQEVDTSETMPTIHALPSMKNVFREDEIKEGLPADEALKNAPSRNGKLFTVPRVV